MTCDSAIVQPHPARMRLPAILTLVPLLTVAVAQDTGIWAMKRAFENAKIPVDLKINFNPKFLLEICFPQPGAVPIIVHAGIQLQQNDTAVPPKFGLLKPAHSHNPTSSEDGPFVIISVDPDASIPQVRHLLASNYTPRSLAQTTLLTNSTPAVTEWAQPAPRQGNHRYIFLVFNQPEGFNEQTLVTANTSILGWNLTQFIQAVGLGDPIAGTFFMVANPDNP